MCIHYCRNNGYRTATAGGPSNIKIQSQQHRVRRDPAVADVSSTAAATASVAVARTLCPSSRRRLVSCSFLTTLGRVSSSFGLFNAFK